MLAPSAALGLVVFIAAAGASITACASDPVLTAAGAKAAQHTDAQHKDASHEDVVSDVEADTAKDATSRSEHDVAGGTTDALVDTTAADTTDATVPDVLWPPDGATATDASPPQDGVSAAADATSTSDAATDAGAAVDAGCSGDADCDDNNSCTLDKCLIGSCLHETKLGPCDDPAGCALLASCDKGVCKPSEATLVEHVAGTGKVEVKVGAVPTETGFNNPAGIALHSNGDAYVVDTGNHDVRRIKADLSALELAAGQTNKSGFADGTKKVAKFSSPRAISHVAGDTFYVADTGNRRIRVVHANGSVSTLAGNGNVSPKETTGATSQGVQASVGSVFAVLALPAGGAYFLAEKNHALWHVSAFGTVKRIAGQNGAGKAEGNLLDAAMEHPSAIARACNGELFVADTSNKRIVRINLVTGKLTKAVGISGQSGMTEGFEYVATLTHPRAFAYDASGRMTFVDFQTGNMTLLRHLALAPVLKVHNIAGVGLPTFGTDHKKFTFGDIQAADADASGRLWLVDRGGRKVWRATLLKGACQTSKSACHTAGVPAANDACKVCDASKNAAGWSPGAKPCGKCKLP